MKQSIKFAIFTFIFVISATAAFGQQPTWMYERGLGDDQLYKKNYAEAVKHYAECIRNNEKADDCYSRRGKAYLALENEDAARANFKIAIKLNPQNQEAVEALAKLKPQDAAPQITMDDVNRQRTNMTPEMKRQLDNVSKSQKDVEKAAKSLQPKDEKDALDYFYEGKDVVEKIYLARTGTAIGSYALIEQRRQTFELIYDAQYTKKLDEAIANLEKAERLANAEAAEEARLGHINDAEKLKSTEQEANRYLALAYLEKAQFVTNKLDDFGSVLTNLNDYIIKNPYYDAASGWRKSGYLISVELRSLVAQNKIAQALSIFRPWQTLVYPNKNYEFIKKEIALPSIAEAFDLTGNFNYTRGVLLATAYEQIGRDGGKFVPANHEITKQTLKAHFRNLGNAYQIPESGKLLSLQIARRAGAFYLADTPPNAAAKQFIINAPAGISKIPGQTAPLDTKLYAARLALQSTNADDKAKGLKLINDILQNDAKNAPALAARGYANYLKGDFTAAEADLSAAIQANIFVAHFNDALTTRALVYKTLGKADLAAKDEKQADVFNQVFGAIAAP